MGLRVVVTKCNSFLYALVGPPFSLSWSGPQWIRTASEIRVFVVAMATAQVYIRFKMADEEACQGKGMKIQVSEQMMQQERRITCSSEKIMYFYVYNFLLQWCWRRNWENNDKLLSFEETRFWVSIFEDINMANKTTFGSFVVDLIYFMQ